MAEQSRVFQQKLIAQVRVMHADAVAANGGSVACSCPAAAAGITQFTSHACTCGLQSAWADVIASHMPLTPSGSGGVGVRQTPAYDNGNARLWGVEASAVDPLGGHWEVAKCFVKGLGQHTTCLQNTRPAQADATCMFNILIFCPAYGALDVARVKAARDTRNGKWGHVASLEVGAQVFSCFVWSCASCVRPLSLSWWWRWWWCLLALKQSTITR